MPGSITAANAIIMLTIDQLFPTPQQIQGFSADNVYDIDDVENAEVSMGVDGVQSAGFVFQSVVQRITLQANSKSNDIFDTWYAQEQAALDKYLATGLITLPAIGRKFTSTGGVLSRTKPFPAGARVLQPRTYQITWERIAVAPV